jgi:hypothetical protein
VSLKWHDVPIVVRIKPVIFNISLEITGFILGINIAIYINVMTMMKI